MDPSLLYPLYVTETHLVQRDARTTYSTKKFFTAWLLVACLVNIGVLIGFYINYNNSSACLVDSDTGFWWFGLVVAAFLLVLIIINLYAVANPETMWLTDYITAECQGYDLEDCDPGTLMERAEELRAEQSLRVAEALEIQD